MQIDAIVDNPGAVHCAEESGVQIYIIGIPFVKG